MRPTGHEAAQTFLNGADSRPLLQVLNRGKKPLLFRSGKPQKSAEEVGGWGNIARMGDEHPA